MCPDKRDVLPNEAHALLDQWADAYNNDGICSCQPLEITVCGGGVSGLASAVALRQSGHRVTVFEANEIVNSVRHKRRLFPALCSNLVNITLLTHCVLFRLATEYKSLQTSPDYFGVWDLGPIFKSM